jgi:hypothetical protein
MSEPSLGTSWRNWREWEGPFREKVRLTLRNNLRKMRTRRNCCGNHGEPGC